MIILTLYHYKEFKIIYHFIDVKTQLISTIYVHFLVKEL